MREHVAEKVVDKERQRIIVSHLKAFFSDTPVSAIDIPMSRRYADARRNGHVGGGGKLHDAKGSDSTIKRELGALVAAANHAVRWKRLPAGIKIEIPRERLLGKDDEAPYYTHEELDFLIGMAPGELRWFIELAYWTGARRRSIEELTRPQVKWAQKRIHLQKPGKIATKKRQPIVPIFEQMEPALKNLWDNGGEHRLFTHPDFYNIYRKLCINSGLKDKSHPHLLRHTRATHLLQAGKSIYAVAGLLGDTVATVERVYGHHSVEYLHRDLGELIAEA